MSEALNFAGAATRARVVASALALGRSLDWWSLALLVLALFSLLGLPLPHLPKIALLLSTIAAAVQKIFALRVAFDEALFRQWADKWDATASQHIADASLVADLAELDQTLVCCGLIKHADTNAGKNVRDLDQRLRGAMGLLKSQGLAFVVQLATFMCAVIMLTCAAN